MLVHSFFLSPYVQLILFLYTATGKITHRGTYIFWALLFCLMRSTSDDNDRLSS